MLNLVVGAAASGKSEYAEKTVMSLPGERVYVATMEPFGAEAEMRIARHRALREGKGFRTIERPLDLAGMSIGPDCNVLVEDLPNLAANETFSPGGGGRNAAYAGVKSLLRAANVTIVTGDIFSDGILYDKETTAYMEMLAGLNADVAALCDNVICVISGLPYAVKGELPVDISKKSEESREGFVFVTGPYASGKRNYVQRVLEIAEEEAAFDVQELLRADPELDIEELAEKLSVFRAVTQCEVGAGVIPMSEADRAWREKAGRLACLLAERAGTVIRMVCGVPVRL